MDTYKKIKKQVKENWDHIAKPIDSLGLLEDMVCKLCAIWETDNPKGKVLKRALVTFCADHGVVCEGVTQTDSHVTQIVCENFAAGKSSVNHMSNVAKVDVFTVDIGMDTESYPNKQILPHQVIDRKIRRGTRNLAKENAMTLEECEKAIAVGREFVKELKREGYEILATGEMGIGNTTPTSVLAAYYLGLSAKEVTGRGAGLTDAGLLRKEHVIERALKRLEDETTCDVNSSARQNVINVLASVGSFEICGMVGMFLEAVASKIPVVIDGAISAVAALVATKLDERVPFYAVASHMPEEKAGALALASMGLSAIIHGRLCLGEGSGAVSLMPLLDMAFAVYENMGTFADLEIASYDRSGKPLPEIAD